jgi:hypothetical protein
MLRSQMGYVTSVALQSDGKVLIGGGVLALMACCVHALPAFTAMPPRLL